MQAQSLRPASFSFTACLTEYVALRVGSAP
jgi:hypothetical protein